METCVEAFAREQLSELHCLDHILHGAYVAVGKEVVFVDECMIW